MKVVGPTNDNDHRDKTEVTWTLELGEKDLPGNRNGGKQETRRQHATKHAIEIHNRNIRAHKRNDSLHLEDRETDIYTDRQTDRQTYRHYVFDQMYK